MERFVHVLSSGASISRVSRQMVQLFYM
jgi:hypothetical protein